MKTNLFKLSNCVKNCIFTFIILIMLGCAKNNTSIPASSNIPPYYHDYYDTNKACKLWIEDRNNHLELINEYINIYNYQKIKNQNASNIFRAILFVVAPTSSATTIVSALSTQDKTFSIISGSISLISTSILTIFEFTKKAENADACFKELNTAYLSFEKDWGIYKCPIADKELLKNYENDKQTLLKAYENCKK